MYVCYTSLYYFPRAILIEGDKATNALPKNDGVAKYWRDILSKNELYETLTFCDYSLFSSKPTHTHIHIHIHTNSYTHTHKYTLICKLIHTHIHKEYTGKN